MLQHLMSMWQTKHAICIKIAFFCALLPTGCYLLPASVHAQSSSWSIDSFDSIIEVHEDASITVTETIDVTFDGAKHGIYRQIPVRYTDPYGNRFKTDFDVLSVHQDNQKASVEYSYNYGYVNIRIGDEDRTITGHHVYEIVYTVDRVFLYFDEYDELYWNVTGTDWEVPIDHTSATVILPDGAPVEQYACYTGEYGSTRQDCSKIQDENMALFAAEDFLTVAVAFPKGFVYQPTSWERFIWLVQDNWYALIPLIILFFTFWTWYRRGRDPKMTRTIIAEYEPPKGIKAVYAGAIAKNMLKKHHLTAMIIQMAVDGYIKIKAESKKPNGKERRTPLVTLIPLKTSEGLDTAHAKYYDILFKGKMDEVDIQKLKGTISAQKISELQSSVRKWLMDEHIYLKGSFGYQAVFLVLGIMVGVVGIISTSVLGLFTGVVAVLSGIFIVVLGYLMPAFTQDGIEARRHVLGFKEFMHTAERYRSAWQEREHIFADYLPYAIAFNDVKKWASTFKGVQQVAPDWYTGDIAFVSIMASGQFSAVTQSIQSAATVPKSSGSGGGGSSGGGFGGGGGGSW